MFPVREDGTFPLSGINGSQNYPIAKAVAEPIPNFAYGKSIPAKTKVDQAIFDEMLKNLVIKTRKSNDPPMANNSGQTLSKRVLWAGNIEDDLDADRLKPIGDNPGVTQAEFNAMQFIQSIVDSKSVSPLMSGQSQQGNQTAREVLEQKKQSMINIGLSILGVTSLERQLAKLRLYNILKNWTEPIDKDTKGDVFRSFTIETSFEDGSEGTRQVIMTEEMPDEVQVYAEEQLEKMVKGKNVRKNYINPKLLRSFDFKWHIEINPTPKESNELRTAQFEESIQKIFQMFVPLGIMPNMDYVKTRWASNLHEDPDRLWAQQQMPQMPQQMPQPQGQQGQTQLSNQLTPNELPRPSVNTMA